MYPKDEIKKNLNDPIIFLRAINDCVMICPNLKLTEIADLLEAYRVRLKESFDIMDE